MSEFSKGLDILLKCYFEQRDRIIYLEGEIARMKRLNANTLPAPANDDAEGDNLQSALEATLAKVRMQKALRGDDV